MRVDGTDPLAVYQATARAREKAVDPGPDELRPTLLEALLYRVGAHNTSDDPSSYRETERGEAWREWDPLDRFESFLRRTGRLDDDRLAEIDDRIDAEVEAAVEAAEAVRADPDEMFDHAYAELPERLREQQAELARSRERHGDDALRED